MSIQPISGGSGDFHIKLGNGEIANLPKIPSSWTPGIDGSYSEITNSFRFITEMFPADGKGGMNEALEDLSNTKDVSVQKQLASYLYNASSFIESTTKEIPKQLLCWSNYWDSHRGNYPPGSGFSGDEIKPFASDWIESATSAITTFNYMFYQGGPDGSIKDLTDSVMYDLNPAHPRVTFPIPSVTLSGWHGDMDKINKNILSGQGKAGPWWQFNCLWSGDFQYGTDT